jgi:hypothetical protein
VRLTEGEELVARVAAGVRRELECTGAPPSTLRAEVERRCWQWALEHCDGDEAAAREKLVRRGITRALSGLEGLLGVLDVVHLDAPLSSGEAPVGSLFGVTDELPASHDDGDEVLGRLLGGLTDAERRAVLWECGIDGDPSVGRAQIERECGLPARSVGKLLDRLGWQLRAPHLHWALMGGELAAQFEHDHGDAATDVVALASRTR